MRLNYGLYAQIIFPYFLQQPKLCMHELPVKLLNAANPNIIGKCSPAQASRYHNCADSLSDDITKHYKINVPHERVDQYFTDNIIPLLNRQWLEILYSELYKLLQEQSDDSFSTGDKEFLLNLVDEEEKGSERKERNITKFLSRTFIYAVQQENKLSPMERGVLKEFTKHIKSRNRALPNQNADAPAPESPPEELSRPAVLPVHNQFFTGREKFLEELHVKLEREGCAYISAIRGLGKTAVARKYTTIHGEWSTYWVDAYESQDIREAILRRFGNAVSNHILMDDAYRSFLYEAEIKAAQGQDGVKTDTTLLVINGVTTPRQMVSIDDEVTSGNITCRLLVTTCADGGDSSDYRKRVLELGKMTENECQDLFLHHYCDSGDKAVKLKTDYQEELKALWPLLEYHPLCIYMVARAANKMKKSPKYLLEMLGQDGIANKKLYNAKFLSFEYDGLEKMRNERGYVVVKSVIGILFGTLLEGLSCEAKEILAFFAILTDYEIPEEILLKWISEDEDATLESLQELVHSGLLNCSVGEDDESCYQCHSLIQIFARHNEALRELDVTPFVERLHMHTMEHARRCCEYCVSQYCTSELCKKCKNSDVCPKKIGRRGYGVCLTNAVSIILHCISEEQATADEHGIVCCYHDEKQAVFSLADDLLFYLCEDSPIASLKSMDSVWAWLVASLDDVFSNISPDEKASKIKECKLCITKRRAQFSRMSFGCELGGHSRGGVNCGELENASLEKYKLMLDIFEFSITAYNSYYEYAQQILEPKNHRCLKAKAALVKCGLDYHCVNAWMHAKYDKTELQSALGKMIESFESLLSLRDCIRDGVEMTSAEEDCFRSNINLFLFYALIDIHRLEKYFLNTEIVVGGYSSVTKETLFSEIDADSFERYSAKRDENAVFSKDKMKSSLESYLSEDIEESLKSRGFYSDYMCCMIALDISSL